MRQVRLGQTEPADLGEIDALLAGAAPVWGPHPEGM
jgi:hypothetical protein